MRVALIGLGYWGKIIYKNLKQIPEITEIKICDPLFSGQKVDGIDEEIDNKYYDYDVDCAFVVVPAKHHKKVVEFFLTSKVHVFCEKPLCLNNEDVETLYKLADQNKVKLFVDWIFTFNEEIKTIKDLYKKGYFGEIKNIEMNRLNFGPVRNDVDARWDLSSHDVSIIQYIFDDKEPEKITWINYKRDQNGLQNDTSVGVLNYSSFDCIINSSWQYGKKFRKCLFEFEKGFLLWDDKEQQIIFNKKSLGKSHSNSPLKNSIYEFLNYCKTSEMSYDQKKLTEVVTEICSHESKI